MTYKVTNIRRRSRNNGINFCQYWVIINSETREVVADMDWKINKSYDTKERAQKFCDKLNDGTYKTEIIQTHYGEREEIDWNSVRNSIRNN